MEEQIGNMKKLSEKFQKEIGKTYDDKVVIQRKGLNESYNTNKEPSYEKVFYEMQQAKNGDFKKIGSPFTADEMTELFTFVINQFKSSTYVTLNSSEKPINVKIGALTAIKLTYVRKAFNNEPVHKNTYHIQDSERLYLI